MTRVLLDIGDTGEYVATIACILFLINYSLLAPWWRNFVGRSIVLLDLGVLGITVPGCLQLMFPHHWDAFWSSDWYIALDVFIVWMIAAVAITRIWGFRNVTKVAREAVDKHAREGSTGRDGGDVG